MTDLYLETRDVTIDGRNVVGRCVPYDETSYLVPGPSGERIRRGAFAKSLGERGENVFLLAEHGGPAVGKATRWDDGADGLVGEFAIRQSALGDETLAELAEGYWPYMSVAFRPMRQARAADGAAEVIEAKLAHVALVRCAAYEGARVLAVRSADPSHALAGFPPRPEVDLSPVPRFW